MLFDTGLPVDPTRCRTGCKYSQASRFFFARICLSALSNRTDPGVEPRVNYWSEVAKGVLNHCTCEAAVKVKEKKKTRTHQ